MAVAHRIYARALFDAAQDEKRLDVVNEQLGDFVAAIESVPELRRVLENPELDSREKGEVLEEILGGADELVSNFVRLVAEAQGRLTVELTTAYELSQDEAASITKKIEEASGRTVDATRKVDPQLIGGIVMQAGSLRVDASVLGRIERLRHELTTSRV